MRKIVSWLVGEWAWWGSQSKLDVTEPFDEHHGPAALADKSKGAVEMSRFLLQTWFRAGNPA